MEEKNAKNELKIFRNNLVLEYNYYLDLFARVEELGTYSIEDYDKAINNYTELKKQYRRSLTIACTLSTMGMAGLAVIFSSVSKEIPAEIIAMFAAFGAFMGLAGGFTIAGEYFMIEPSKDLAVNNSIDSLKERQKKIIEETNILFKNSTNLINFKDEREKIKKRIAILECAIEYIQKLESSLIKKYFSDRKENILYDQENLTTDIEDIRKDLSYGYYLVKTYL